MQQWESPIVQMVPLPIGCVTQWTVAIFHPLITSTIKTGLEASAIGQTSICHIVLVWSAQCIAHLHIFYKFDVFT